jgi:hypothetical protein
MPSGPTGRREESVRFSLKELLKLEDERLEEQERAKNAREAALAREREEAERRRRVEAEADARAEAEARERQRQVELEELARREAMQKAIVEQGRLEVEIRARADERERERHHELAIEKLRSEGKSGQSIGGLIAASAMGGAIMLGVMLAVQLGVMKPAANRRIAELQQSVIAADSRADDLTRQLADQRRLVGERDRQLVEARTQIDALKTKKPSSVPAAPAPSPHKLGPPPPAPKAPAQPDCDPHDPMCFSLKAGR